MTDFSALLAPDRGEAAVAIRAVNETGFPAFRARLGPAAQAAVDGAGFRGRADQALVLPDGEGWFLALGTGPADGPPGRWTLAAAAAALPEGSYRFDGPLSPLALHGWLMAQHRFTRYRKAPDARGPRRLLVPEPAAIAPAVAEAEAAALVRDLVDTPAEDMGPAELEAAVRALAETTGARVEAVAGEALLERNLPAVHAVGRASPRRPRLLTLAWGEPQHPLVALVGKGITFDTGGLNLKPGNAMALMKKDMGGAAHALALARLVIGARLPVRVLLVIATADNAVSGNALRPGDVIATRKGLSVEVGNTDAEGRLVLADALTLAGEAGPALILDFATLTGAARVALGPDLPALFVNDETLATDLLAAATEVEDPLWRLPLWAPYREMLRSTVADLGNVPEGSFAGAIAGALFLTHFLPDAVPWAHLDLYAWNGTARPGRPKGGAAMGLFAAFRLIARRFGGG
ncbi:MAG: leucyl aminopeptidase family protein [Thermaurantiacus tibetensis]|uniref:leucyl aminopeptidase family protein n=1 Tax=Thermaurantiacus tibetensis TaxID=2759035 RepID=UPI0018906A36|nr:leucyl aminopeptidase family protein [Thermaurantiacus tibetensis]